MFKNFPHSQNFILKDDDRLANYCESPVYQGSPDALYFARDEKDICEILNACYQQKIPVTFCGSRTALTGASMANSGLLIAMEKQNHLLDCGFSNNVGRAYARAQPGILLGDLKAKVSEAGYLYPPDPTSYKEAQLGATVATNATGEDTYSYGPTRNYVREIKIITAQGETKVVKRQDYPAHLPAKANAGYYLDGDEIDQLIGSEGTLALITEVTLDLIEQPQDHFALLVPFASLESSLEFVRTIHQSDLAPRALELIGPGAYEIFSQSHGSPSFPKGTQSLIYLKKDYRDAKEKDSFLNDFLKHIENCYRQHNHAHWADSIFLGENSKQKDDIRTWRHFIPATINELARSFWGDGGGKISTDWWVPMDQLISMMQWTYEQTQKLKIDFAVFGHIGNGHPHWNFITKNSDDKKRVQEFVTQQCQRVVSLGGGLAGEHGLGKIHHDYLSLQYPQKTIDQMIALKNKWDPRWILGQDNILPQKAKMAIL